MLPVDLACNEYRKADKAKVQAAMIELFQDPKAVGNVDSQGRADVFGSSLKNVNPVKQEDKVRFMLSIAANHIENNIVCNYIPMSFNVGHSKCQ